MNLLRPRVSIVLSDRSWILEHLGQEIQNRIEGVQLNDAPDPSADINYYITFACREQKAPTLEMAWFAHMEQMPHLQSLFYDTARSIDLPVTHSDLYRDMLHAAGISSAITISPGVDRDRFDVKLRIGVVGRAYHTGRKGEALVDQLIDMPGIDWHFTGSGWPKPGLHLPDDAMPDFYRSMDYILVPALYEGGPMCVPEALAVGTPVIASNVGWVSRFPHIPFRTGDADDLRRVLSDLLAEKRKLRESTAQYTWDNFAAQHDRAFHDLIRKAGGGRSGIRPRAVALFDRPVRLLMHGNESTSLGGPSVRVPRTAQTLQSLGVTASASTFTRADAIREDVVHLFNVWNPDSALRAMRQLKRAGKTVVFSPIYLDLGERDFWHTDLPALPLDDPARVRAEHHRALDHLNGRGRLAEAVPGYNAIVRELLDLADHVIFLSEVERQALAKAGAHVEDTRCSLVRNPVDAVQWHGGDPTLFRDAYLANRPGPKDYVVCVGRIEPRKNQLLLVRALLGMAQRIVLIGHVGDPAYEQRIREEGGNQVLFVGRLDPGGDMLRSALAGARVFALPSWAEGASLAALEAAAAGSVMVLSDRSSEREYFGDLAFYCDPGDPDSIRQAVKTALRLPEPHKLGAKVRDLVGRENSWEHYARATAAAYARATAAPPRPLALAPQTVATPQKVYLDITTLAHHQGRITGISRVESQLAQALQATCDAVTFICWNDSIRRFVEVPARFARFQQAFRYRARFDGEDQTEAVTLPADATLIVAGSAWMQNTRYVRGLEDLKTRSQCSIVPVIHDLVPYKFPFWFDAGYAPVFRKNFERLAAISDKIATVSRSCAIDVENVLGALDAGLPPITPIRSGDPEVHAAPEEDTRPGSIRERFQGRRFILAVGAIHARKNYEMLYRVWARFADEGQHGDLHLVIVGGVAWNGKALAKRIEQDPRVNRTIHIATGVDDDDLGWLYENCLLTVFPSLYEGWGLPVAESLVHRKLCLATSASSVPEIAPDVVEHIDPEDFIGWHQKISFYASSASAREVKEQAIAAGYQIRPWIKTAEDLLTLIRQPVQMRGLKPVMVGTPVPAGTTMPVGKLGFGTGWHPPEEGGRWTAQREADVSLNLFDAARHAHGADIFVLLRHKAHFAAHFAPAATRPYSVSCGDRVLYQARVTARTFPAEVMVRIPPGLVAADGTLRLKLAFPPAPEIPGDGKAPRDLGLMLHAVTVLDAAISNPLQSLSQTDLWFDGTRRARIELSDETQRDTVSDGMVHAPAWGAGAQDDRIDLLVPILPTAPPQTVDVDIRPIAARANPVKIVTCWNGTEVACTTHTDDAPARITFRLDDRVLGHAAPGLLTVRVDSLLTPGDLAIGSANGLSGVGVFSVTLRPEQEG